MIMMLVLVLVIGVVAGGPTVPGCCTPSQWEATKINNIGRVQGGTPRVHREVTSSSYDENSGRIAYNISSTLIGQTGTQYTRRIFDYKHKIHYAIDLNTQTCQKLKILTPFLKSCLPADAKQEGDKFYYGFGTGTTQAMEFTHSKDTYTKDKHNFNTVMTAVDCFTIAQVTLLNSGVYTMESIDFINYTLGIKDPSVFTPPGYCQSMIG